MKAEQELRLAPEYWGTAKKELDTLLEQAFDLAGQFEMDHLDIVTGEVLCDMKERNWAFRLFSELDVAATAIQKAQKMVEKRLEGNGEPKEEMPMEND